MDLKKIHTKITKLQRTQRGKKGYCTKDKRKFYDKITNKTSDPSL